METLTAEKAFHVWTAQRHCLQMLTHDQACHVLVNHPGTLLPCFTDSVR